MKLVNQRTFSASFKALALLAATTLGGCSAEIGDQEEGIMEEASEDGTPGDLSDKAGDSYVQWCNQPASQGPYGTVCRQQNCSGVNCLYREQAAIAECRSEVRTICGSPSSPFVFIAKYDGYVFYL
jgi:hypothetical protein